jgi:hypothetical protein
VSMPDARGLSTDTAELAAVFTHFAENRCGTYAPLYARLGAGTAGDRDLQPSTPLRGKARRI